MAPKQKVCDDAVRRQCALSGCEQFVKKPTAKYCSIACCATDPVRHARLRTQAQRSRKRIISINRQLSLGFDSTTGVEAQLAALCGTREDLPAGMSRLAVSW